MMILQTIYLYAVGFYLLPMFLVFWMIIGVLCLIYAKTYGSSEQAIRRAIRRGQQ
jgi:hypothetical protein